MKKSPETVILNSLYHIPDLYFGLTGQQKEQILKYIKNLKSGDSSIPLTDKSIELTEENKKLYARIEALKEENREKLELTLH